MAVQWNVVVISFAHGCMCTKEEEIEIVAGVRVMSSGEFDHRELEKSRGTFRVAVNILVSYLRRMN